MTITITKSEVLKEVEKRTSLEGLIAPDRYDTVWTNEHKADFLENGWIEGCGAIVQLVKEFASDVTEGNEFSITLAMPKRFNDKLEGSINESLKMAVACNMVNRWLSVTAPEVSPKYDEEAKSYFEDARIKLYTRVSPTRTLR